MDTTKLLGSLPLNEVIIKIEKRGMEKRGQSKRDKIKHRAKSEIVVQKNTGFGHNSITLVMMNNGYGELPSKEITVKIFQNGVFHMTGVLDDRYDKQCISLLLDIIWTNCQDCIKEAPAMYEITNRRVVLMNYTTKFTSNETIARESLYVSIRNAHYENITCHYDPDVYPGVKIHIGPQKWTAKVFRTGKIILTGITTPGDCTVFIQQLLSLFALVLPSMQLKLNTTEKAGPASML
jgi:TATA-box binding protein (TBP) (component of TFIID and TFIIIB)